MNTLVSDTVGAEKEPQPSRHILVVAALSALSYGTARYSGANDPNIGWALITAFLLWRIWLGHRIAWIVFITLSIIALTLCILIALKFLKTDQSQIWNVSHIVYIPVQLGLLTSARLRRWMGVHLAFEDRSQ